MASSLKAPCVSIFGPTSNLIWGPWRNPNSQVVYKNLSCRPCCQDGCGGSKISDCLVSLPVDNVMNALDTVINKRKDISVVKE
jgi:heptosyltransferase-3